MSDCFLSPSEPNAVWLLPSLTQALRAVALYDKMIFARTKAGFPRMMAFIVSYPSSTHGPSIDFLRDRLLDLQERFPSLCARIEDRGGIDWRWTPGPVWTLGDIVREDTYDGSGTMETLLEAVLKRGEENQLSNTGDKPLWLISRLTSDRGGEDKAYFSFSINHALTDGAGAAQLLLALLKPSVSDLPRDPPLPKMLEDTIPIVPPEGWKPPSPATDQWPGKMVAKSPLDCPGVRVYHDLSVDTVDDLRAQGKVNGIKSLHPILATAYYISLHHVLSPRLPQSFTTTWQTPINERQAELGHPLLTYNYYSLVNSSFSAVDPSASFWQLAKEHYSRITDPDAIQEGRYGFSMLHSPKVIGPKAALERARSETPLPCTGDITNLTKVNLPPGSDDLRWTASVSPFLGAVEVHLIGHEGGIRADTGFRDGCATHRTEMQRVGRLWQEVIGRVAAGEGVVCEVLGEDREQNGKG